MSAEQKSGWDKADIVLKPVGGLLTALAVVWLGHAGRAALETRQITEANTRLYAELMSSRERADSSLRQGMFQTIIDKFLSIPSTEETPSGAALERDVLRLEILAYNFHDALDLAPLFKDVHRKLTGSNGSPDQGLDEELRAGLLDRLEKVAREVTDKQIAALEDSGAVVRKQIILEEFATNQLFQDFINGQLHLREDEDTPPVGKSFAVDVVDVDKEKKEVEVRLTVWPLDSADSIVDITFHVGFFDFPMIDNTRIENNERCAIVLTGFGDYTASLALVYFPGSRASLKEKPFYDEIINQLSRTSM
ncbi:MAG: hypothetical protein QNJ07_13215 [Woeseiaceae bacterium]|nr:hypothetical protein [Woeseiaceae bacterium]